MIPEPDWVTNSLIGNTKDKISKPSFCQCCKDHSNKQVMLAHDARDAINLTAKYYNCDPSDVVMHVRYVI